MNVDNLLAAVVNKIESRRAWLTMVPETEPVDIKVKPKGAGKDVRIQVSA